MFNDFNNSFFYLGWSGNPTAQIGGGKWYSNVSLTLPRCWLDEHFKDKGVIKRPLLLI